MRIVKNTVFTLLFCMAGIANASAQEVEAKEEKDQQLEKRVDNLEKIVGKLNNFTFSGYFQAQYINAQKDALIRIGAPNQNLDESFSRVGIRRSRLKVTYEEGLGSAVFQLDFSERGIVVRDAYLKFKDPWLKTNSFQAGIFFRPFGHEVRYSSSRRQTPERSRVILDLFPNERDLGAMIQLQAPKTSPLNIVTLEAALIAGNGVIQETDNRRDLIGHIKVDPYIAKNMTLSTGISYYRGSVYQGTENVYRMEGNGFVGNNSPSNLGAYAKREYLGFELLGSIDTQFGKTQLRSEFIFGQQPASQYVTMSPNSPRRPTNDTYIRDFQGGYVFLYQDIGKLPFAAVARYDWYDPNTKIAGDDIGINRTTEADLNRRALGLGAIWKAKNNLEVQAYYEINKNETTQRIANWSNDQKDNIFTLCLLYKY